MYEVSSSPIIEPIAERRVECFSLYLLLVCCYRTLAYSSSCKYIMAIIISSGDHGLPGIRN